jgi:hypothetical protein
MPANLLQAGPAPQWHPPPNFPHIPLPVEQYPGLPRNAIAHVQHAHRPRIDYNVRLNEQMNAAHNDRRRLRNLRWHQDRDEIRQEVQDELRAAGAHPPQQPHVPAPPVNVPHLEVEHIRNHLLQRQAQEEFRRQQILQQEVEHINRDARYALEVQQHEAEHINRQNRDILRVQQQEEEDQRCRTQRIREQQERQQEAMREYNLPASQEHHDDDEERRRIRLQADREEREEEDQQHINQVVPIPVGGRPYREPINPHYLGRLDIECPNCHANHFISEKLSKSSI